MKKEKEYFKVVYYMADGKYYSAWVKRKGLLDFMAVNYQLNKWAYPRVKDTMLFCFDNLYDAKSWAMNQVGCRIFKCEVGLVKKSTTRFPAIVSWKMGISPKTLKERLRIWWRGEKLPNIFLGRFTFQSAIRGTIFTDKIKLIKEV